MQITLNPLEVAEVISAYALELIKADGENTFIVNLNDDGSATVLINEESEPQGSEPSSGADKQPRQQKRARRTKAQIEADEAAAQAEADAAKNTQAEGSTQTGSAETAPAGETVSQQGAEATDTSSNSPGAQPEPEVKEEPVVEPEVKDPEPEVQVEPEPEVSQEDVAAAQPTTKPAGVSLFANLRKPNNG